MKIYFIFFNVGWLLISTVLWLLNNLLSLTTDVNIPTVIVRKKLRKIQFSIGPTLRWTYCAVYSTISYVVQYPIKIGIRFAFTVLTYSTEYRTYRMYVLTYICSEQ